MQMKHNAATKNILQRRGKQRCGMKRQIDILMSSYGFHQLCILSLISIEYDIQLISRRANHEAVFLDK